MARNILKPVFFIGLALALVIFFSIILLASISRTSIPTEGAHGFLGGGANAFARELRDFDLFDAPSRVLAGENPAAIERRLSRLQRQARGVEEHLSVLKRRRSLALLDRRYLPYYERSAREAAQAFPFSAPLAVVAAEAVILGGAADARAALQAYAAQITQPRFARMELALRILAGNLDEPAHAAGTPGLEALLAHDYLETLPSAIRHDLLVNEFLLRAVRGDIPAAAARLNVLLASGEADGAIQRMAADFFYDHDNPRRAAELFARLAGESGSDSDIVRLADALALAGEIPGARNIWSMLANPAGDSLGTQIARSRHFYNMAATSTDRQEEALWLERLFSYRAQRGLNPMDSPGIYSVIRYTRLMDTPRSITVLLETATAEAQLARYPLLDLELLRRRLDTWPPNRAAAEVWLLLNRHGADEIIHEWAAWYFEHRRLYAEAARLLNDAAREGMSGQWIDLHRALSLMRAGDLGAAEIMLRETGTYSRDWRVFANLGRIYESRRQISSARAAYETAAVLVGERTAAAQVQLRLSRNLEALGHRQESRAALERALELDPDNLNIRRELRRFGDA
ncbi:MAG: hypothetical protein FWC65_06555 [Treponema sp.]|nr:hypothetical protein [Treponema sp.]